MDRQTAHGPGAGPDRPDRSDRPAPAVPDAPAGRRAATGPGGGARSGALRGTRFEFGGRARSASPATGDYRPPSVPSRIGDGGAGQVTRVAPYGAFVDFLGYRGLVHISQLQPGHRVERWKTWCWRGTSVVIGWLTPSAPHQPGPRPGRGRNHGDHPGVTPSQLLPEPALSWWPLRRTPGVPARAPAEAPTAPPAPAGPSTAPSGAPVSAVTPGVGARMPAPSPPLPPRAPVPPCPGATPARPPARRRARHRRPPARRAEAAPAGVAARLTGPAPEVTDPAHPMARLLAAAGEEALWLQPEAPSPAPPATGPAAADTNGPLPAADPVEETLRPVHIAEPEPEPEPEGPATLEAPRPPASGRGARRAPAEPARERERRPGRRRPPREAREKQAAILERLRPGATRPLTPKGGLPADVGRGVPVAPYQAMAMICSIRPAVSAIPCPSGMLRTLTSEVR